MAEEAVSIGADTFQYFSRNPRGGKAKALDPEDLSAYRTYAEEHAFPLILAHAPYTMNPAGKDERVLEFAHMTMADDLKRLEAIPGQLYNFHPGSHVGQGTEVGIGKIVECLDSAMWPEQHTTVLLETMAGKGSEIGGRFEELCMILDRVKYPDLCGVCLDTCHIYDGGYDIVQDLDGVLDEFDRVIGLKRLKAVHLNDSKNPFASHRDRHEKIGQGSIGLKTFERIVTHPALAHLPFFLETPNELPGYAAEIALLRSFAEGTEKSGEKAECEGAEASEDRKM